MFEGIPINIFVPRSDGKVYSVRTLFNLTEEYIMEKEYGNEVMKGFPYLIEGFKEHLREALAS